MCGLISCGKFFPLTGDLERKVDACIQGFLASVDDEARGAILLAVAEGMDTGRVVRLFQCAPFRQGHMASCSTDAAKKVRDRYWQEVVPQWNRHS